jgi:uncharacterized protein involved in cysteine biosynthesis
MPLNSDPPLGFMAPWRGLSHILTTRGLWVWAAAPFLVSLVIYVMALGVYVYGEWKMIGWMWDWFSEGFWGTAFKWFSVIGAIVAGALAVFAIALAVNEGVNGFFLTRLARKTEVLLGVEEGELKDVSVMEGAVDVAKDLAGMIGVNLLLLGVGFIPVAGVLVAIPLGLYFNSFRLGVEFLELPMGLRGMRRSEIVMFAKINSHHTLGLGMVMVLAGFVPLVGPMLAPSAAVGAVLLYRKIRGSGVDALVKSSGS